MNTKNIFSWLLLLFGEAIIITAFILFRGSIANDILTLNIVVASVIYCSFFIDILVPWINFQDKSHSRAGSLGIRWFATWLYAASAVIAMICGNFIFNLAFTTQLIIHCILFFLFLLGLLAAFHSSDKVREVYEQEMANRNGINEMKAAVRKLKDKINDTNDLPENFISRINTFENNLRFISPANSQEAYELEDSFVATINDISFAIANFSMNEERIESNLKKLERIYQNRKNIYSN